jgi:transglutaminase superfamily protein
MAAGRSAFDRDPGSAEVSANLQKKGVSPYQQARVIYEYVTSVMKYDKTGKGWGRGDAVYACDIRRGNCTDFHSPLRPIQ